MNRTFSNIYSFKVKQIDGQEKLLSAYRNKVLLIVNTASECGFTNQFKDLQQLKEEMNNDDFEILAFPSNDFGKQEPLNGIEILQFCERSYGVSFPVFEKIFVRGADAHPLYQFLADKKQNNRFNIKPRWNFHKYLINKQGELEDFFYPFTKPQNGKLKKKITRLLAINTDKI
ncbi:glutathione peroxidase [Pedobacter sp. UYP30]|uniref:glutathione peroxidase n=1 Tax=Pedobacter sp. UYP30 TaxID=1756400 RepID=UPI003399DA40